MELPIGMKPEEKEESLFIKYDPNVTVDDVTRMWVVLSLEHHKKNKSQAARALGITIKTLYTWLAKWGLSQQYAVHK